MALRGAATVSACLLVVALAVAVAGAAGATSPAPSPGPAVDCQAEALKLVDCLDFVQPGSASSRPSKACCGEVKSAVKSPVAVGCLCTFFGSKDLPLPLNVTRAYALPKACGASADVFSKCHAKPGAPTEAPSPSAGAPSSGGSAAAPAKNAAARSPSAATAAVLVAAVAAPLLALYHI